MSVGCERPSATLPPAAPTLHVIAAAPNLLPTPTLLPTSPPATPATATPTALPLPPTPSPLFTPTPFYNGPRSPVCGQRLPILPTPTADMVTRLTPDANALAHLQAIIPSAARPALQHILANPGQTGLALYRMGQEAEGVYLNADVAMPLASVVKILHLITYVEAVAAGQLNPLSPVPVETLDNYYLPNFDLGAHRRALAELEADGRLTGTPPTILLQDIPWMMIRHSSNAATDYLHQLLGQTAIEETAVALGLTSHTAPCSFLGQFLAMSNHTRQANNDRAALEAYLTDPTQYQEDVSLLADAFSQQEAFRQDEVAWRRQWRRPSIHTQRFFTEQLNAHATPRQYAGLMLRLAQNGLSSGESSFLARQYLEWPMRFPDNQPLFDNLGYKNGTLPGTLTTIYYAYPKGETVPLVIALFFHNLPHNTYQQWRDTLPHDELARWLLYEPAALPALRAVLSP